MNLEQLDEEHRTAPFPNEMDPRLDFRLARDLFVRQMLGVRIDGSNVNPYAVRPGPTVINLEQMSFQLRLSIVDVSHHSFSAIGYENVLDYLSVLVEQWNFTDAVDMLKVAQFRLKREQGPPPKPSFWRQLNPVPPPVIPVTHSWISADSVVIEDENVAVINGWCQLMTKAK